MINGRRYVIIVKRSSEGESKNGAKHLHDHFASRPLRKTRDITQIILKSKITNEGKVSLGPFSFNEEVARKELASLIILHEYPLTMVEYLVFRRFVGAIQSLYKNMSRGTVKRDIFKIYKYERAKTTTLLGDSNIGFAITLDMWTSSNQKKVLLLLLHIALMHHEVYKTKLLGTTFSLVIFLPLFST